MPETFTPAFPDRSGPFISYGIPFTEALPKHADETFHASRVYVICSGSLARNTGYLDELNKKLGSKFVGARIGMKPHSHWSEILEVVADCRAANADLIVTLGGGSLTDAAKMVSLALANDATTRADLSALCQPSAQQQQTPSPSAVPVVSIPTSLSGGEYSPFAGATDEASGRKYGVATPGLRGPALVILDPAVAATTPERVWLSTGVKAVDHCVEALCSLRSTDAADADARAGLARLVPGLLRSARHPEDLDARLQCQLGVADAMGACTRGVPLGASHGIGHQLGPAGVGHGETSCVLNPAVCKYNYGRGANVARQDAVADLLWRDAGASEVFGRRGLKKGEGEADLGDLMDAIIRELGMPRTLREFGIGEDKLDSIAEHSLHDRWVQTNPAPLDKNGVLEILRMVLE
ncbi:putative Fe-containing alcohol dehydrogenase [Xylariaceae sp. FL0662B]|nr:putative Fe-containing alcohol dehydrogenase [Xylariaceae sp. FL0662B]